MQGRERLAIIVGVALILCPLLVYPAKEIIQTYRNHSGKSPEPAIILGWLTFGALLLQVFFNREQSRTSALQADIADRQRKLTERQADISDRQLRIIEDSNRPLVLIQTIRWAVDGWHDQKDRTVFPGINVELVNFGNEVALTDYCRINLFIGVNPPKLYSADRNFPMAMMIDENGNRSGATYINWYRTRRGLMPNGDEWEIRITETKITCTQVEELDTGHQKAWIDAAVFYDDIRRGRHETLFRYVYDNQADMFLPDESAPDFNRHT